METSKKKPKLVRQPFLTGMIYQFLRDGGYSQNGWRNLFRTVYSKPLCDVYEIECTNCRKIPLYQLVTLDNNVRNYLQSCKGKFAHEIEVWDYSEQEKGTVILVRIYDYSNRV